MPCSLSDKPWAFFGAAWSAALVMPALLGDTLAPASAFEAWGESLIPAAFDAFAAALEASATEEGTKSDAFFPA